MHERLSAAAEEIFALFERTIVEYEEELCRCKEESLRKQHRLDQALNPSVLLHMIPSPPPPPAAVPGLKQEITETAQTKEETQQQNIREEPLSFSLPEACGIYVKTEDPSMFLQINSEHHEETQGEDINPEPQPQIYSQSEGHKEETSDDDDWDFPAAQMETEAGGDHNNQIQITEIHTAAHEIHTGVSPNAAPGISAAVEKGNMLGTVNAPKERRKHQCFICPKEFRRRVELERHIRVHTGERPYCCSICTKSFTQKVHLEVHMRTHSSEKPYSCTVCSKTFSQNIHLRVHFRTHTGERPYRCSVCKQTFTQKVYCQRHMLIHTEDNP